MPKRQKLTYSQLETGHEFPVSNFQLDRSIVTSYLRATEDDSNLYLDDALVPPMAIAAYAMEALSENIYLPPGTIHVSQELEFLDVVAVDDSLISYATVSRKQSRGKLNLLAIDLNVFNQRQKAVLSAKTSFVLPDNAGEKG